MSFLSLIFGHNKLRTALKKGAVIIDVRTPNEFDQGRVGDSINIPVDRVAANAARIKEMKRPVIFCCASGVRSGNAVKIMKATGLKEVYNGGSWLHMLKLLKKS
ncbi:MAG: rhodanese-like domain-containing protein [Chitinophagaceae bacterium]